MNGESAIGVGVIGLGFMGRTHISAFETARGLGYKCRLTAVCDMDGDRRAGKMRSGGDVSDCLCLPRSAQVYADADALIADQNVDLVSICTPTDTHVELAVAALDAGKHVLVEKPVSLSSAEIERLVEAAQASGRHCMPAMCMRFWPGWDWLKRQIDNGPYGPVRSATFTRLAPVPNWSTDFYLDDKRSGGALFDLHIHDADFVRWCFGDPQSVECTGSIGHATTIYRFADGLEVSAEGGWVDEPGFAFRMACRVTFDEVTVSYDSSRDPLLTFSRGAFSQPIALNPWTGYDGQVRHLLDSITNNRQRLRVTVEDAVKVVALLEAERASLESGKPQPFPV